MKVKLICIGKTGKKFLEDGENEYMQRVKHYVQIERVEIPDLKNARKLTFEQIKQMEGKEILSKHFTNEQLIHVSFENLAIDKGIYCYKISSNQQQIACGKLHYLYY